MRNKTPLEWLQITGAVLMIIFSILWLMARVSLPFVVVWALLKFLGVLLINPH